MNLFDTLIVQPIFNLLVLIYSIIPGADFGIALIIVTILIRFALWPLVKRQLHQTKAMRKIQPELKKIKKNNKNDRQAQGLAMMNLYKENGIKPFRSIVVLLIQLPVFIALYRVIRIFTMNRDQIEQFTYSFLQHIPVIEQIIKDPNTFNENLLGFIDLTSPAFSDKGINIAILLIVIAGAVLQYFISKQTMPQNESKKTLRQIMSEAGEGQQPDQAEMNAVMSQNMIKFMPFMMFFIMASLPAALSLYYVVSNLAAFFQQRHILNQDQTELEKLASKPKNKKPPVVKKARTPRTSNKTPKVAPVSKGSSHAKIKSGATVTRITAKDSRKK